MLASRLWGAWEGVEQAARRLPAAGEAAGGQDDAARAFRYERRLLSADELGEWLARWGLEHGEWHAWLGERNGPGRGPLTCESLWLEAVCSGALESFARALAARIAALAWAAEQPPEAGVHAMPLGIDAAAAAPGPEATAALGVSPAEAAGRLRLVATAEEAFARLCRAAVTERAVTREIAGHAVDWLRLECDLAVLRDRDVASEVALSVREEGLALAQVATRAGATAEHAQLYAEQLEPDLGSALVSAAPGALVGPLPGPNGGFALFEVQQKVTPSSADPEIRARAEEEVRQRAVEREVAERVRWHDGL